MMPGTARPVPFSSVLADAKREERQGVPLVYQPELPNLPGESIKGVLVK
jgi:hypothetical protein